MNLVERAKAIIFQPKSEWVVISQESTNVSTLLTKYLLPLALIPTIASLIGYGLIGHGPYSSFTYGLMQSISTLVLMIGGVFLSAFIIDMLAPGFGGEKNYERAFALVAYTYTPQMVAGVLYIFPPLGVLVGLAGLYGLYILYQGLSPMMKNPQEKTTVYFIVSLVVIIVVYAVLSAILGAIFIGSIARSMSSF